MRKHITATWHQDADGHSKPNEFVGKRYFHAKTSRVYVVTDFTLDAERALWLLKYRPERIENSDDIKFSHTIADFTREGRFLEIKE